MGTGLALSESTNLPTLYIAMDLQMQVASNQP
jgi:hypothetical protein